MTSTLAEQPADKPLAWGLLAVMAWAPLPLGSNRPLPMAVLVSAVALLALAFAWAWRRHATLAIGRLWQVRWPLGFLLALALWQSLQMLPIPESWLRLLSPNAWEVHAAAGAPWTLSLDPFKTQVQSVLTLAYTTLFALVVLAHRDQRSLQRLVMAVVVMGVFQAVLAILLFSIRAEYSLFFVDITHDRAKGSLVYHNHFAGYMELCLSMGIGLMLAKMADSTATSKNWHQHTQAWLQFVLSPQMRLRLMLVVMVIALVLTRSRMGNAGFFTALLITGLIALWVFHRAKTKLLVVVASLVVVDLVVVGSWVGVDRVMERVQGTELMIEDGGTQESVEQRQMAAKHAAVMVQDFALFGTGAGSFASAFVRYQAPGDVYFDHAHNDYVQWAAEHGWGGGFLVMGLVLSTLYACSGVLLRRRSSLPRGVALGVVMACLCLAIHSTVDFNLQLPSNAMTLVCILAMAWAAKLTPSIQRSESNDQR